MAASGVPLNKLFTDQRHRLCNFANAVSVDLNTFDTTKPSALCGDTGYSFSGCHLTQQGVVQQKYIQLRLLANRFRRSLNDLDKSLNLNVFKTANLNYLETQLPEMLNQVRVNPLNSVGPSISHHPTGGATPLSSLNQQDCTQLNSLFGGIEASYTHQAENAAVPKANQKNEIVVPKVKK